MSTTIDPVNLPPAAQVRPITKPHSAHKTFSPKSAQNGRLHSWAWKLALVIAAVALLSWGAYQHFFASNGSATTEITSTVKRSNLPITVTERGDLESSSTVDARCEVEGYQNKIVTILPEGKQVKKGEVVVTFDADQLKRTHDDQEVKWKQADGKAKAAKGELEVARNKAESEIAKAELALLLANLDRDKYIQGDYRVELDDRKGQIKLTEKGLHEAQEKLENFRMLVKKGFEPPEKLRSKELEVEKAQYELSRDKEKLSVLENFTLVRQKIELEAKAKEAERELKRAKDSGRASVEKAQSDLEAAEVTARLEKTALDRAKKQLERTIITAPQDGILVYSKERYWDMSNRIQAGAMVHFQQTIFSLPDLSKMQVKVKIHEAMVEKIKPGQKAEIRVESHANIVLHGTVEKVATLANVEGFWERDVKEYLTIVKVDNFPAEAGLKPGMTAEVKILADELYNVLNVPVQAVSQKGRQHYSYVAGANGIERRDVTIGANNEKFVEIKSGLEEGEKVTLDARARVAAESKDSEETEEKKEEKKEEPPKKPAPPQPAPAKASAQPVKVQVQPGNATASKK